MDVDVDKSTCEQDLKVDKTNGNIETDNDISAGNANPTKDRINGDVETDVDINGTNENKETDGDINRTNGDKETGTDSNTDCQTRENHSRDCGKDSIDTTINKSEDTDTSGHTESVSTENGTVEKVDDSLENSELTNDNIDGKIEVTSGAVNGINRGETSDRNMGNKLESEGNKAESGRKDVVDAKEIDKSGKRNANSDNSNDHNSDKKDVPTNNANSENTNDLTKGGDAVNREGDGKPSNGGVNEMADESDGKSVSKGESELDEESKFSKDFTDLNDHSVKADVKQFIDNVIADINVITSEDEDHEVTNENQLCELKIVENVREGSDVSNRDVEKRKTEKLESEQGDSAMTEVIDSEKTMEGIDSEKTDDEAKLDNNVTNTETNADKKSKKKKKKRKKNKSKGEGMVESKSSDVNNVPDTKQASDVNIVPDTKQSSDVNNVPDTKQASDGNKVPESEQSSDGNIVPDTKQSSDGNNVPDTKQASDGNIVPDTKQSSDVNNVPDTKQASDVNCVPKSVESSKHSKGITPDDLEPRSTTSINTTENVQVTDKPIQEREEYKVLLEEKSKVEQEAEMLKSELAAVKKSLHESHNYLQDERAKHNHQIMMLKFQLYHTQMAAKHQFNKTNAHMSDVMANLILLEGRLQKEQVIAARELKTRADVIETQKKEMVKLREQNDQLLNAIKEICAKGGMNGYLRENKQKNGESASTKEKKTHNGRFGSMRDKLKAKNRSSLELNNFNLEKYLIQNDRLCSSHEDLHRIVDDRQRHLTMNLNETQKHTKFNSSCDNLGNKKGSENRFVDDVQDMKKSTSESSELNETTSSSGVYSMSDMELSAHDHLVGQHKDGTLGDNDRIFYFSSTHLNSVIDEEEAVGPMSRSGQMMSMGSMPMLANIKHEGNISNKNRPHSLSSMDLINLEKEMHYMTDLNVTDNARETIETPPPSPSNPTQSKQELTPFQTFKTMFRRKGSKNKGKKRSVSLSQTTNTEYSEALKKHFQKYDMS